MLYLVATPIGNLADMTYRAVTTLREAQTILAEDTRVTKKLLDKYEINSRLESFHAHNEHKRLDQIIQRLKSGEDIALVSDAGSPGISDPGYLLIRACLQEEIEITAIPGPAALIPAVTLSGIPCDKFYFEGFLPQKKGKQKRLKFLLELPEAFVLYESPFRVVKTLKQIVELTENEPRKVAVCRELTKLHEEIIRGQIQEVIEILDKREKVKGEIVIVISGKNQKF